MHSTLSASDVGFRFRFVGNIATLNCHPNAALRRVQNADLQGAASGSLLAARQLAGGLRRPSQRTAAVGRPPEDLAANVDSDQTSTVMFCMSHTVLYGETVKVVGDGELLGDWDLAQAPDMVWGEGDCWRVELDLPAGTYDFKFVVQRNTGPDEDADWEAGSNRSLLVPNMPSASAIIINGTWSDTSSAFLSMSLDDEDGELGSVWAAALDKAQDHVRQSADSDSDSDGWENEDDCFGPLGGMTNPMASVSSSGSDSDCGGEGGFILPGVQEHQGLDTAERAVDSSSLERLRIPTPDDLPEVEGLPQPDEEPPDDVPCSPANPGEPSTDESAEPLPGGDSGNSTTSSSSNSSGSTGNGSNSDPHGCWEAEGALQGNWGEATTSDIGSNSSLEASTPSLSVAVEAVVCAADSLATKGIQSGRASSAEAAAGGGGLAAVAVVVWSLAALRDTGCGLPPGPGGMLGATEGLSYLVVAGLAGWGLLRQARRRTDSTSVVDVPGALLTSAQAASCSTVAVGLAVLALQVSQRGYVPGVLPDSNCFGGEEGREVALSGGPQVVPSS